MAKDKQDAIAIFTDAPVSDIIAAGGSGDWVLNPNKASRRRYLVCCRKHHHKNQKDGAAHRSAFLVGIISSINAREATNNRNQRRYFIEISEVARIDKPNVWGKWQNPVVYTSLGELGIELKSLKFLPLSDVAAASAEQAAVPGRLTIAQAKKALAITFGVKPEDIEITVRG